MRDNFAIDYCGLGDGRNVLPSPHLRVNFTSRKTFRRLQIILRDVSETETE